ncbi:MAG: hypothetical protein IT179_14530 [Acidobacteria bacterium]|nr:hypothetical protein [Acidobacteriota bacterium]
MRVRISPGASIRRRARLVAACLVLALGFVPLDASVRLLVPEDSPGGPFYARLERGIVLSTSEWVAIAFYRDPRCVPAGFNLLNFFDFGNIPAVFACPLTVHGFEIWANGPAVDQAPIQSRLRGNGAVPVWFVSVGDYQSSLPGVTKAELLGMPSLLQGSAAFFDETLHAQGAAKQSMLELNAFGLVPDGRSFRFHAVEAAGIVREVQIEFR